MLSLPVVITERLNVFPTTTRSAIWRFKEENRALMKRLYGDMESNSVYREMRAANLHKYSNGHHG